MSVAHQQDKGADLLGYQQDEPNLTLIIVQVASIPFQNYVYKLNSVPPGRRPSGPAEFWDLGEVMSYYAQWLAIPVMQHWWIADCLKAGRFLGEEDNWGGWRIK